MGVFNELFKRVPYASRLFTMDFIGELFEKTFVLPMVSTSLVLVRLRWMPIVITGGIMNVYTEIVWCLFNAIVYGDITHRPKNGLYATGILHRWENNIMDFMGVLGSNINKRYYSEEYSLSLLESSSKKKAKKEPIALQLIEDAFVKRVAKNYAVAILITNDDLQDESEVTANEVYEVVAEPVIK